MSDTESKNEFESWAIVEIMGHRKLCGRVTEETIGGAAMIRIDVPPVGERDGAYGQSLPERPAFTQYFNSSSIFSLTPCTEEVARQAADRFRDYPVDLVSMQPERPRTIKGPRPPYEDDDDDDLIGFDEDEDDQPF